MAKWPETSFNPGPLAQIPKHTVLKDFYLPSCSNKTLSSNLRDLHAASTSTVYSSDNFVFLCTIAKESTLNGILMQNAAVR